MIRRTLKWIVPALLLMCVVMSAHEVKASKVFMDGNELVRGRWGTGIDILITMIKGPFSFPVSRLSENGDPGK